MHLWCSQLFNGSISNTTVALNKINSGATIGYSYLYDQLNRLLGMRQHNITGTSWSHNNFNPAYEEKFSYDANGNIKTLVRQGANITGMPLAMDNLKYFYYYTNTSNVRAVYDPTATLPGNVKSLSNQLAHVDDTDPVGNYTDDIDDQVAGNYDYDNIGNLIKDVKEGITQVEWTVYGKIKQIKKGAVTINFTYDVGGNRVSKEVIGVPGGTTKQFYIRDASGNTMAIYNGKTSYVEWSEQHLYGSSRLGIWNYGKQVPLLPVGVGYDSMMVGSFNYELTNHLGNVLSTISDKKIGISTGGVAVDYYNAEVLNQNDYYAFGSLMTGRKYSVANTNYRYGFNGIEKLDELTGEGNHYTALFGEYDPRVVYRWNLDPKPNPSMSPYSIFSANPIWNSDPLLDTIIVNNKGGITRNDNSDNLVFMAGKNGKLTSLGELGKTVDANTIYKNLAKDNAKEAKATLNPITFYNKVKTGGDWDLKSGKDNIFGLANILSNKGRIDQTQFLFQGKYMEAQDVGNHHFGIVGKAYGLFSEEYMLRQAGEYQIKSGTSKPIWQPVIKVEKDMYIEHGIKLKTIEIIKLPPYGDDPRDQKWIKAGFQYYKDLKK